MSDYQPFGEYLRDERARADAEATRVRTEAERGEAQAAADTERYTEMLTADGRALAQAALAAELPMDLKIWRRARRTPVGWWLSLGSGAHSDSESSEYSSVVRVWASGVCLLLNGEIHSESLEKFMRDGTGVRYPSRRGPLGRLLAWGVYRASPVRPESKSRYDSYRRMLVRFAMDNNLTVE